MADSVEIVLHAVFKSLFIIVNKQRIRDAHKQMYRLSFLKVKIMSTQILL